MCNSGRKMRRQLGGYRAIGFIINYKLETLNTCAFFYLPGLSFVLGSHFPHLDGPQQGAVASEYDPGNQ